jgi:hypothetical protein
VVSIVVALLDWMAVFSCEEVVTFGGFMEGGVGHV